MQMSTVERIKAARQAGRVQRYHTLQLSRPEKVAEHSFNVFNLLMILTEGQVSRGLTLASLMHDMGEYVVGDIPSPVKKAMSEETKQAADELEEDVIDAIHPIARDKLSEDEKWLLKVCDNLDGLIKCTEELRMGNYEMIPIGKNYALYVEDLITVKQAQTKSQVGLEPYVDHFTEEFFEEVARHER